MFPIRIQYVYEYGPNRLRREEIVKCPEELPVGVAIVVIKTRVKDVE